MWRLCGMALMLVMSVAAQLPAMAQPAADMLFNTDGYRIAHYRGPVPHAPNGVPKIAPAALAQLKPDIDIILIDVLPAQGGQRQVDGRWRLAQDRPSIPGAHWFPESGRGDLTPDIAHWFERGVARLSGGDKRRMIVTYCLADCWMGWNAARRLRNAGYSNVWWLAEGTDGWRDRGLPFILAKPER